MCSVNMTIIVYESELHHCLLEYKIFFQEDKNKMSLEEDKNK